MNKYFELIRPRHLLSTGLIFLIGSSFYWKINGFVNNLIGLISFLLIYASVYIYNDLNDLEIDKKHYIKWKRNRPLVTGIIKPFIANRFLLVYVISGLIISLLVNYLFFIINGLIILINFSYSKFQLKSKPIIGNSLIIFVQLLKLFGGWFSNGLIINGLPLFFFIAFVLEYGFILSVYKKNRFVNKISWKYYLYVNGLSGLFFVIISMINNFIVKRIIFELLLIIIAGVFIIKFFYKNMDNHFLSSFMISFLFSLFLIISILLS